MSQVSFSFPLWAITTILIGWGFFTLDIRYGFNLAYLLTHWQNFYYPSSRRSCFKTLLVGFTFVHRLISFDLYTL